MNKMRLTILACLFSLFCLATFNWSCTKKFDEINTDINSISGVSDAELPFLFSYAQKFCAPWAFSYQTETVLFADQYAQYFANVAPSFPSDRLVIRFDWLVRTWNSYYADMVPQLKTIFENTSEDSPEYALANVVWVVGLLKLTDYFGPIPYFSAGIPERSIPYDSQEKIYDDFLIRLTNAVNVLKANLSEKPFGNFDMFFQGDAEKWIRFANTLRLRLAVRISKADPERARAEAEAAVAGGVMMNSPGDDVLLPKSIVGYDYNGLSQTNGYNEFRMSAAMESVMVGYHDPRLGVFFSPAGATADNPDGIGKFKGVRNGLTSTQLGDPLNQRAVTSRPGKRWTPPGAGGDENYLETPLNVMSASEAYFLRAEGVLLGWNMGGTVVEFYEAGIRNSMAQWGVTDQGVINAYINGTDLPIALDDYLNSPPVSSIPVKLSGDPEIQLEQVATQKWLSLYPNGQEAWADYRRGLNFKLYPVANSDNPDIPDPTTQWLRRIPFLLTEKNTNGPAVQAAESLLGGPDKVTTPLWWDKN